MSFQINIKHDSYDFDIIRQSNILHLNRRNVYFNFLLKDRVIESDSFYFYFKNYNNLKTCAFSNFLPQVISMFESFTEYNAIRKHINSKKDFKIIFKEFCEKVTKALIKKFSEEVDLIIMDIKTNDMYGEDSDPEDYEISVGEYFFDYRKVINSKFLKEITNGFVTEYVSTNNSIMNMVIIDVNQKQLEPLSFSQERLLNNIKNTNLPVKTIDCVKNGLGSEKFKFDIDDNFTSNCQLLQCINFNIFLELYFPIVDGEPLITKESCLILNCITSYLLSVKPLMFFIYNKKYENLLNNIGVLRKIECSPDTNYNIALFEVFTCDTSKIIPT